MPPEPIPAMNRYDGTTYRILRKLQRDGEMPPLRVLILSAKYGILLPETPIGYYEQLMSKERAEELRPEVHKRLDEEFSKLGFQHEIFINMGKTYMHALDGYNLSYHTLEMKIAKGGIGQKNSQMRNWILRQDRLDNEVLCPDDEADRQMMLRE